MAITNYLFSDGKLGPEEDARLATSMNKVHFAAERYFIANNPYARIYDGEVHAGYIPILLHRATGDVRTVTRRSSRLIRKDSSDLYLLSFPLRGSLLVEQNNRAAPILPGSFVLTYANTPVTLDTLPDNEQEHESLHVLASSNLMAKLLPDARRLCGTAFQSEHNGADIAKRLLVDLYYRAESMDMRAAQSLATSAIETILLTAQKETEVESKPIGKRQRSLRKVLDYIALHCFELDLSAQKVANSCDMSKRYLHQLLARNGKNFNSHLWEMRLRSAYEQLTDPRLSHRTISEIAYLVGFKSNSHFSRAFKAAFDMSPRKLRFAAQSGDLRFNPDNADPAKPRIAGTA